MLLEHVPRDDRQAEAEAAVAARGAAVGLTEPIEDVRQELGRDAGAGVAHRDFDVVAVGRRADVHVALLRRELDGVGDHARQHLVQALGIAVDRRQAVRDVLADRDLLEARRRRGALTTPSIRCGTETICGSISSCR